MSLCVDLLLVAAITSYVVDVSGFTQSWRTLLARKLRTQECRLRPLPPFDCGKCAIFWTCLLYCFATGQLTLPSLAFCAGMSLVSFPLSQALIFIREGLTALVTLLMKKL